MMEHRMSTSCLVADDEVLDVPIISEMRAPATRELLHRALLYSTHMYMCANKQPYLPNRCLSARLGSAVAAKLFEKQACQQNFSRWYFATPRSSACRPRENDVTVHIGVCHWTDDNRSICDIAAFALISTRGMLMAVVTRSEIRISNQCTS